MDHTVTVKGEDKGKASQHGKPKKDRTEAIGDWIVDNNFVYTAIYQHVKQCEVCSAETILRAYLSKREHDQKGMTSGSLIDFALKMERLRLPPDRATTTQTVNEFLCRTGTVGDLATHWLRLSVLQRIQGSERLRQLHKATPEMLIYRKHGEWLREAGSDEEFERRMTVLEVQEL